MARPIRIDDDVILSAAREVFLEKGISATTAEIAQRAGVAEGTLFHRFGNKAALFNTALRPQIGSVLEKLDLKGRVGKGDLAEGLVEILGVLIDFLRQVIPQVMMTWSNRADTPFPDMFKQPNPAPLRVLRELSCYFEAEIRAARVREVDPEVLARACVAGAVHFVFIETLGGHHGKLPLPQGMYVRGLVDILLLGVLPAAKPVRAAPRASKAKPERAAPHASQKPRAPRPSRKSR